MAVKYLGDGKYTALAADTKPTNAATNAEIWVTDADHIYRYNGSAWVLFVANDKTETLTNKTISELTNSVGVVQPYTWIVYQAGSVYKAKSGITALTPYSGTSLKTDVWDW